MKKSMKKIAVLASGGKTGGSGFEALVDASKNGDLGAEVACVLSNYEHGGVRERADRRKIPFEYFESPWTAERCYKIIGEDVDLICMSGWLQIIKDLDSQRTVGIHPGPLRDFGGKGWCGDRVHKAMLKAYRQGLLEHSAVSMYFVTDVPDGGPPIYIGKVPVRLSDTVSMLRARVRAAEHYIQWRVIRAVLAGEIYWDGVHPESVRGASLDNLLIV